MENRQITDFTSGSIPKHLITFAVPMFLGNMLQALYNTVDSIWVGRFLGPEALGAVSVGVSHYLRFDWFSDGDHDGHHHFGVPVFWRPAKGTE